MFALLLAVVSSLRSSLRTRRDLALENLALRQQLAILKRQSRRPRLTWTDRAFWVGMVRAWEGWREVLVVVEPETVIRWFRKGFGQYWARKSRGVGGRPGTGKELRALIRKMALANPLWGAPRIHGELRKLGIEVSQRTVSRLMPRRRKPRSQGWRTFLDNHVKDLVSMDFFVVPTATFEVLFGFVVLAHERRRVVHFNVTRNPTSRWVAQQLVEAFPWDSAPRYVIRDRDRNYEREARQRIRSLGIEEVVIAARSPWQSPYVERLIGSIRRECLDHVVVLGEGHLRRILKAYLEGYYQKSRTHLALAKDCPHPREVEPPEIGEIVAFPEVGGLHHRYGRAAA